MTMRRLGKVVVGILAVIGAVTLVVYLHFYFFFSHWGCEEEVLARAVTQSGALAALHVRRTCKGGSTLEHTLYIEPARPGVDVKSSGYLIFRSDNEKDHAYAISIRPLRLWWLSEDKLHVEYPREVTFSVGDQIGRVRVEAKPFE